MNSYEFHIGDYYRETRNLSQTQHYIYRSLLDEYYLQEVPLSDDTRYLMRVIGLTSDQIDDLVYLLDRYFILTDDGWINNRANEVLSSIYDKSKQAKDAANKRWQRAKKKKKPCGRNADVMRTQSGRNADAMLPSNPLTQPALLNNTAWSEFERHRKDIKKPMSDLARTKAMNVIKDLSHEEQAQVIDKTIQNRWTGLFTEKSNGAYQKTTTRPESNHARVSRRIQENLADDDEGA